MSLFHIPVMLGPVKVGTQEGGLPPRRLGAMKAPQNKTLQKEGETRIAVGLVTSRQGEACL
jgi:hypothetical protein